MKELKIYNNILLNKLTLVFFLACLFILNGNEKLYAQNKPVDLARYTPSWIIDGFADAGATHEPWIFQVRRNNGEFNQWQKKYYEYQQVLTSSSSG